MGQYYQVVFLAEKNLEKNEIIRIHMCPWDGLKLLEHSHINNTFVNAVEFQLSPKGMFYKTRVVWAGDYADVEEHVNLNLYKMCYQCPDKEYVPTKKLSYEYKYILNHTKNLYVDKSKYKYYHPLPLLTVEGNGNSNSDYHGEDEDFIGMWSRDVISVQKNVPDSFIEITYFQK